MAVSHENVGCQQAWKDYSSANKKSLQIRCLELEKQVNPGIRDYDALESNLKEIKKILEVKNQEISCSSGSSSSFPLCQIFAKEF